MSDMPVDLTATRHNVPGQGDFMRIQGVDHQQVMVQLDMSLPDYALFVQGETVIAAFSPVRTP